MNPDDLELHAWPLHRVGGQQIGRMSSGVLIIHKPTGIAAVSTSERSQLSNKRKAMETLQHALGTRLAGDACG